MIHFHDKLIARLFPKRAHFCEWLPLADAEIAYTEADKAEAKAIWAAHRARGGMAWKDPRTSLFLDLWRDILPDAKFVISLRHPYQVHRSLLRRGEPFLHVDYSASILGWTVYNQRILKVIAWLPKKSIMVIEADSAFRTPQKLTESLAHFLDLPLTEKALESIDPGSFHFEDDYRDALEHFGDYFPLTRGIYRSLRKYDRLNPIPVALSTGTSASPIPPPESKLLEFEEEFKLREQAKRMLVRSITVDRQRTADFYKQLSKVDEEKDRLIKDLSQLNEILKRRITEPEIARTSPPETPEII